MALGRHVRADPPHPPPKKKFDREGLEVGKGKRAKPYAKEEERDPLPTSEEIATAKTRENRRRILAQFIERGRYRHLETCQKFERLWPDLTVDQIARLAEDAAEDLRILRGSHRLKSEAILGEAWSLYARAKSFGQLAAALNTLRMIAEMEGVLVDPNELRRMEHRVFRLVRGLLEKGAPHLIPSLDKLLAEVDREMREATRTIEVISSAEERALAEAASLGQTEAGRYIDVTSSEGQTTANPTPDDSSSEG